MSFAAAASVLPSKSITARKVDPVTHIPQPGDLTKEEWDALARAVEKHKITTKAESSDEDDEEEEQEEATASTKSASSAAATLKRATIRPTNTNNKKKPARNNKLVMLDKYDFAFAVPAASTKSKRVALAVHSKEDQNYVIAKLTQSHSGVYVFDCETYPSPDVSTSFAETIILKNYTSSASLKPITDEVARRDTFRPIVYAILPKGFLVKKQQHLFHLYFRCIASKDE